MPCVGGMVAGPEVARVISEFESAGLQWNERKV